MSILNSIRQGYEWVNNFSQIPARTANATELQKRDAYLGMLSRRQAENAAQVRAARAAGIEETQQLAPTVFALDQTGRDAELRRSQALAGTTADNQARILGAAVAGNKDLIGARSQADIARINAAGGVQGQILGQTQGHEMDMARLFGSQYFGDQPLVPQLLGSLSQMQDKDIAYRKELAAMMRPSPVMQAFQVALPFAAALIS
jgi:hypothetical protein